MPDSPGSAGDRNPVQHRLRGTPVGPTRTHRSDRTKVKPADTGPFRHVVYLVGDTLFGLHQFPSEVAVAEPFTPYRPGLDHVSFAAADRGELEKWQRHLDELGI